MKRTFTYFLCGFALILVLLKGEGEIWVKYAVALCGKSIIPSLFPFMVLGSILVKCGGARIIGNILNKPVSFIFGMRGQCVLPVIIGYICGYPVGSKAAADMVQRGEISTQEGNALLAFCNNAGPMFILSATPLLIGVKEGGGVLWVSHILSSVIIGIFAGRTAKKGKGSYLMAKEEGIAKACSDGIKESVEGMLGVCGYVIFFSVIIGVISKAFLFIPPAYSPVGESINILMRGFMETVSGLSAVGEKSMPLFIKLPLASLILGWSGMCVHMQVATAIGKSGLSMKKYFMGKLAQTVLSTLITLFIVRLMPISQVTASVTGTNTGIRLFAVAFTAYIIFNIFILLGITFVEKIRT
ncbi:MAG: hypothetical protein IJC89_00900 [Clostridia bacterium]|nr:hypothetical protein [Clostridia bacterium]